MSRLAQTTPIGANGLMIADEGWRMWPDTKANWKNDKLFLPEDVTLQVESDTDRDAPYCIVVCWPMHLPGLRRDDAAFVAIDMIGFRGKSAADTGD
jgi:hypothetical protein